MSDCASLVTLPAAVTAGTFMNVAGGCGFGLVAFS